MISAEPGGWAYWPTAKQTVRILSSTELWGRQSVEALTADGAPQWIPVEELLDPGRRDWSTDEVAWRSAAARAGHLMARGEPVALARGLLDPLPHQLAVLDRALSVDPIRLLLADEVGLGKTIEAGLIYTELKARRRVNRVLVVAPKGVQLQWVAEMRDRFGEEFALVGPSGVPVDVGINPWRAFDRVVCSIDSVKPLGYRPGVDPAEIDRRNEERFERLVDAEWDLVIIDEAHHAAGATPGVARHELASVLSQRCRHLLLLSATPHSGKSDAFARLLSLVDKRFLDAIPLTTATVGPYLVRSEKRSAVDQSGRPLFLPRTTSLEQVPYGDRQVERRLYEAVTEYVRHGYEAATREGGGGAILLLLLMQRLASSSTAAVHDALERRLAAMVFEAQLRFFPEGSEVWGDLTGEEQVAALEQAKGAAWGNERAEVEILIDLARRAIAEGPDAKARHLLDLLRTLQRDESDPSLKLVVFTQFVATQDMLLDLLDQAGVAAASIHGGLDLEERRIAQEEFRTDARVLVSTDAGGEGINLQFAHVVVNYDLPWNPMRVEQRIGRVDRIGQKHAVRAFNLVMENSIDERVLTIFEKKLATILAQLGVDKRDDILETVGSNRSLEQLFVAAITDPDQLDTETDEMEEQARLAIEGEETFRSLVAGQTLPTPKRSDAAQWAELAYVRYEEWSGRRADGIGQILDEMSESPHVEAVPVVAGDTRGIWSLWEVKPDGSGPDRDFVALYLTEDGSVRPDLAERMWIQLAERQIPFNGTAVLDQTLRMELEMKGRDFAYRACQDLRPDGGWRAPVVTPRMIVKVTT
ncbi:MAG: helicase-related protein [Acidimicrobiia bacterium]|nr:helicase-related protein [Acidimicrobiia bacterium]